MFSFTFFISATIGAFLLMARGGPEQAIHRFADDLLPGIYHKHNAPHVRLASNRLNDDALGAHSHENSEGPMLVSDRGPHLAVLNNVQACPSQATVKVYDLAAIELEMVLNRWGDRDPQAYMFALRDQIPKIRIQEGLAGSKENHYGLSLGVGDDPIQPLTIRANIGDCVRFLFTNTLDQPAGFHIHGADLTLAKSGEPALSSNPESVALPGETIAYEWYIDDTYYSENTHYLHTHGPRERWLVSHGLFGALVVEPAGSDYLDPRTGRSLCRIESGVESCLNSWDAIISPGDGSADFREFAMFYHEIGNAMFSAVDANGIPNPNIDPVAHSYKPNGRAINYRSESFFRRLGTAEDIFGFADESQAYGSYAFGDPAMPVPQSYLGDPTKFRLVHGGSETFHVPHLHGGGIQWQRQADVGKDGATDYTPIDAGLKKIFEGSMPSAGNDSQTIGPSETYELEIACGSGGCQQAVGDYLFHCHVASHYISGMWHFWRVYNTLQSEDNKTDELAVVVELPDRKGHVDGAVTSSDLIGKTVTFAGNQSVVDEDNLATIVETQLPPPGRSLNLLDAAVMDWSRDGTEYLNEPETSHRWPNFSALVPGERLPLLFDPETAQLAWPFLRPHLGKRPPFAPHHGPAPFLEPTRQDRGEPALPGANGPTSLCPTGSPQRLYKIHAIQTSIPVTKDLTDPDGMIFVLQEHEQQAREDPNYKTPLAFRANQGDCLDIILVNELEETGEAAELSKTNIHIHFVQFDVQASDGVISGASYEQSPRPFTDKGMSTPLTDEVPSGSYGITVLDASRFHIGSAVAVGIDQSTEIFETAVIAKIDGNQITFEQPLKNSHAAGEQISVEFVRYRWYVARQNGAIYFHDHVDALKRWGHGLFGALIAEPRGASYHDPVTGNEIRSGTIADIRVEGKVLPGLEGSFREYVLFMNDNNPLTGSSFNLRAEPLFAETNRGRGRPDLALSSVTHGDPFTPVLRAYTGDPLMFRMLTTATEEVHPFHITGHRFRLERFQPDSPSATVFGVGISERFNAYVEAAGGGAQSPGDYLYYNGAERHFREGSWGILRVHNTLQEDLQPLPGRTPPDACPADGQHGISEHDGCPLGFPQLTFTGALPPEAADPGDPCPTDAPTRFFEISAIDSSLVINRAAGMILRNGRMYVLDKDIEAVLSGAQKPDPLVVRANAGDCINIQFTNRLEDSSASLHLDSPTLDPLGSLGINVGFNPKQTADPGESISYRYYVESELGAILIRDFGNLFRNPRKGLYGALIVEPAGSTYLDPVTGEPVESGIAAVIAHPDNPDFREFVTLFHDSDPDIGLFVMPYDEEVNRLVAVNYRLEPLSLRLAEFGIALDGDQIPPELLDHSRTLFNSEVFGDPNTNVFETYAGEPVRFRVLSGFSEQNQVFAVEGHQWEHMPSLPGSDVLSSRHLPSTGVLNIELDRAGGPAERPGDYQWGNHRLPYQKAGQWGILRVLPQDSSDTLIPLPDCRGTTHASETPLTH